MLTVNVKREDAVGAEISGKDIFPVGSETGTVDMGRILSCGIGASRCSGEPHVQLSALAALI